MRQFGLCIIFLCLCGGCCLNRAEGEIVIGDPIERSAQERFTAGIDDWLNSCDFVVFEVNGLDLEFWRWFATMEVARFASARLGLTAGSPVMQWSQVFETIE